MRKLTKGQVVKFDAIDNFTGQLYEVEGKVIGSAKKGLSRYIDVEEYGEVTDDDYVVLSNRRLYLVNVYEIKKEEHDDADSK